MKLAWPEKLPSDPIEAAKIIFDNLELGKGLDYVVAAINENRGNKRIIVTPNLLKNAKVISLETNKIRLLERRHRVKLLPLALVLPSKDFDEIIRSMGRGPCCGRCIRADKNLQHPFNEIGFSLVQVQKEPKHTKIIAWHELRHHIYDARTEARMMNLIDSYFLGEIFAFVVDVKSRLIRNWYDVAEILKSVLEKQLSWLLDTSSKNKYSISIDFITAYLWHLARYYKQDQLDEIILSSNSIEELDKKLGMVEYKLHREMETIKELREDMLKQMKEKGWKPIE